MKKIETGFNSLLIFECQKFQDDRGFFREVFNKQELPTEFVQDNESFSKKNILRGLHFQKEPYSQGKLVRVIQGKVQDIVVDLRSKSPTFKKYYQIILDGNQLMYIPPGFAHGFLALEDSYFHYKCTNYYYPQAEAGIMWNDPHLNLPWQNKNPIISKRDQNCPTLNSLLNQI